MFEVGIKVIVTRWGRKHVDTVDAITPSGLVKVSGILYKAINENTARARGNNYGMIEIADSDSITEIENQEFVRDVLFAMHKQETITYEQAKAIAEILSK